MKALVLTCLPFLIISSSQNVLNHLEKGDKAPDFAVVDQYADSLKLQTLLDSQKVVLIFYRGAWCPHCNKHLKELQKGLKKIENKNAKLIAVSPEVPESIDKTLQKTKAEFSVVHDEGYKLMSDYGVKFRLDKKTQKRYKRYGIDVAGANGNSDYILPVPATFIIGKDGIIDFVHFDKDYKNRASVQELLLQL